MVTKYRPHCHLYLTHEYYRDGWSRDFDLMPHGNTRAELRRSDMLIRQGEYGISLYYSGPEAQLEPLRPISRPQAWQFALIPRGGNFSAYTDLGAPVASQLPGKPLLYFSNYGYDAAQGLIPRQIDNDNNALLTADQNAGPDDVIGLTPRSFHLTNPTGQDTQVTVFKLGPGQPMESIYSITGNALSPTQHRLNLPPGTQGLHLVVQQGVVNTQQLIYVDEQLYRQGAPGLVEIFRQPPVDYQQVVNYYVEFYRRSATWKYYVLNESFTGNNFDVEIRYVGMNPPAAFPADLTFTPVASADLTSEESRELAQFAGADNNAVTLYRSQSELPYYEDALSGLALLLRDDNGNLLQTLINNLPNPDIRRANSHQFIKI